MEKEIEYKDIKLICKQTGVEFIWTAGEQKFFAEKGLTNPPKVCPEVRQQRKMQKKAIEEISKYAA